MKIKPTKISAIIVILLMTVGIATVVSLPSAKAITVNTTGQPGVIAQAPTNVPVSMGYPDLGPLPAGVTPAYEWATTAYLAVEPDVCGVGQTLLIEVWASPGMYHAFYGEGYIVNIIKPDGTTQTLGPVNSYTGDGTYWWDYAPDEAGTWQFQFIYPGTYLPAQQYWDLPGSLTGGFGATSRYYNLGASVLYEPSQTVWYNVTVLSNLVASWPPAALPGPGDYWTRPVNLMNREWQSIAGNYPFSGIIFYPNGEAFYEGSASSHTTPDVQAPTSCHVVWRFQNALSGLIGSVGGQYGVFSSPGTPTIIYDGRCYQTITKPMLTSVNGTYVYQPTSCWECYDLQTGKIYWDITGYPNPPTNIIYELGTSEEGTTLGTESNGYAIDLVALVGGSTTTNARLLEYNPLTGAVVVNATLDVGITSSILYGDPYVMSIQQHTGPTSYWLLNWTISGWTTTTTNAEFLTHLMNNVSWTAAEANMSATVGEYTGYDFSDGVCCLSTWNYIPGPQWCIGTSLAGWSMLTGQCLFTFYTNETQVHNVQAGASTSMVFHNGYVAVNAEEGHWNCWNDLTGALAWTSQSQINLYPWNSTTPDYPWGEFQAYSESSYDINDTCSELIACTYGGLFGINWADGTLLWHYYDNNTVPFESPYGGNSFFTGCEQADGMVYSYAGEHTPSEPIDRGWDTVCLNATNGQLIWEIENTMVPGAVSDGYLCAANQDDGYMYVFGMGQSATTVSAPLTAVTAGTPIMIDGTVMDESPAQPGTPCVSDASMAQQMEYLHMQQPITGLWQNTTMTGVPITITATDQSGTVYSIGVAVTNPYDGSYGISWTPPSAGTYHIGASFYGDDSYGSSGAGTNIVVVAAPAPVVTPTLAPTATPQSLTGLATNADLMTYILVSAIVIIIAIAIATVILLRRK